MGRSVLDASAVLALLNQEPGSSRVVAAVADGASISAVNLSEVVAKLVEYGMPIADVRTALDSLSLDVQVFDVDLAYAGGLLRPSTRAAGLSLGDRACLALAERLSCPALTADRAWRNLPVAVPVEIIR